MDEQHNVIFRNLVANHTSHGANMKAVGQGGGTISDILFENLTIIDLPPGGSALVIDAYGQWSAPAGNGNPAPVDGQAGVIGIQSTAPRVGKCPPNVTDCHSAANITFRDVRGTGIGAMGYFMCRADFPCTEINLINVNLTGSGGKDPMPFQCANVTQFSITYFRSFKQENAEIAHFLCF